MPKVIKRQRTKGWRMPVDTVYVGRPTKWGNPWKVGEVNPYGTVTANKRHARAIYLGFAPQNDRLVTAAEEELQGKDLACWCVNWDGIGIPPGICHAEVLLQLANPELNCELLNQEKLDARP